MPPICWASSWPSAHFYLFSGRPINYCSGTEDFYPHSVALNLSCMCQCIPSSIEEIRRHDHERHHLRCDNCYSPIDGRHHRTSPGASAIQRASSSREPLVRRPGGRPCLFRTNWPTRRIPSFTYSHCRFLLFLSPQYHRLGV